MDKHTARNKRQASEGEGSPTASLPPSCNTGVLPTIGWQLDWLSYTAPEGTHLADVLPKPLEWDAEQRGMHGYNVLRQHGYAKVLYWGAAAGMGTHVQLSSQAIAQLVAEGIAEGPSELLAYVVDRGFRVSRLDVAIDDRRGLVTRELIDEALVRGALVTRYRGNRPVGTRKIGSGEYDGWTFYLGAPTSDSQMRIYDKAAEQKRTAEGPWVRFELQFRDDKARSAAAIWRAEGSAGLAEVVAGYIRFVEPNPDDANKSRWRMASWWAALLGTIRTRRVGIPPVVPTLQSTKRWLETQVSPALAMVVEAASGDVGYLYALLEQGRGRLRAIHRSLIADALRGVQLAGAT